MKVINLLLLLLFLPFLADCRMVSQPDTNKIIAAIRSDYKACNDSLPFFEKKEFTSFDESTEGSLVVAYYYKSQVRKIIVTTQGETGKAICEYYLKNSSLIFAFYYIVQYDRPFYEQGQKQIKLTENRFYFNENKLLRWIDERGKQREFGSKEYIDQETLVLTDFRAYIKHLTD
jgi:hypothetical protein